MRAILLITITLFVQSTVSFSQQVIINNRALSSVDEMGIYHLYGVYPVPGKYWYDPISGIYGVEGGPAAGVMYPGHRFGPLSAQASNGRSGVFINGRQLQHAEALYLAQIFGYQTYTPGRYWMAANGNIGVEGYAVALGNVYAVLAQVSSRGAGGDNFWAKGLYSAGNYYTGADGRPSQGYVSVPGYGPVSHGM